MSLRPRRPAQQLETFCVAGAVHGLQHQAGAVAGREGRAVGLHQAEWVLALEDAHHVEAEQEHEAVVEAEVGAGDPVVDDGCRERQRLVGDHDMSRRLLRDCVANEPARGPHLVDAVEGRTKLVGELVELPEPLADGVAALEEGPPQVFRGLTELVGVDGHQHRVVPLLGVDRVRVLLAADRSMQRHSGNADPCATKCAFGEPGRFADPQLGLQVPDQVDAVPGDVGNRVHEIEALLGFGAPTEQRDVLLVGAAQADRPGTDAAEVAAGGPRHADAHIGASGPDVGEVAGDGRAGVRRGGREPLQERLGTARVERAGWHLALAGVGQQEVVAECPADRRRELEARKGLCPAVLQVAVLRAGNGEHAGAVLVEQLRQHRVVAEAYAGVLGWCLLIQCGLSGS